MSKCKLQKLFILEGLMLNGLQIGIQHIFFNIIAPVKIDFSRLFEYVIFRYENRLKVYKIKVLKAWDYAQTIIF